MSPAEDEAALAAEIQKRAEARDRLAADTEETQEPEAFGETEKKGFWSRLFRRQSNDQVAEFYSEPEGLPELGEDETEVEAETRDEPHGATAPRFETEPSELETGHEDLQPVFRMDDADSEEELPVDAEPYDLEPETPAPAPAPRRPVVQKPIEVPVARGSGDGTPVLIERRIQVPITLGAEEVLRGARLRLVLEIEVEASETASSGRSIRDRVA